ncbi:MAG: AbrB/MazE/SpoVT family DNA-binding domain-containing protein [Shinella sp.]|nr:AbrB/MazE/SpoVT family DNA-binding domain-containing protein [Shinella sp.]
MNTAKVFWTDGLQAVRLPKEFQFETDEIRIRRRGDSVILEPLATDWTWLDNVVGPVDEDFAAAAEEDPSLSR